MNIPNAATPKVAARASEVTGQQPRAVIYLRVSTTKQAETDLDPEGLSLPAQRDACLRKAAELGAEVVEEYVDRGESAKTANRPRFQAMVQRITTLRDIDYVILDKVNRFARNRRDDANSLFELRGAGATLVSVKENIDETPTGALLHGIMATVAEYESRNNGTEALKGMRQKARVGGTPGRAPIGYLNVRLPAPGNPRGIATIEVDPERAPLVQWAFEQYATGEWTTQQLTDVLEVKGLRSLPGVNKPTKPLQKSRVARMLSNPYYTGVVTFDGLQHEGRHEPIIDRDLFNTVQGVLAAKSNSSEKTQRHHHYLKGSVFCRHCASRLVFSRNNGNGGSYDYFKCQGPQNGLDCPVRYVRADWVEDEIERFWQQVTIDSDLLERIRSGLVEHLAANHADTANEVKRQRQRLDTLNDERTALLRAHLAGAVPLDLLKQEQERIAREITQAQELIRNAGASLEEVTTTLDAALRLISDGRDAYRDAGPAARRHLNQAVFERFEIDKDDSVGYFAEPFQSLHALTQTEPPGPPRRGRRSNVDPGQERTRRDHRRRPEVSQAHPRPLFAACGWNMQHLVPPA